MCARRCKPDVRIEGLADTGALLAYLDADDKGSGYREKGRRRHGRYEVVALEKTGHIW